MAGNYYSSSFFWNSFSRILKAIIDFISVPVLLKYFGIENYGVLTLATAANAYMRILDLGLNVGVISYFSKWRMEGNHELINRIAGTNITFYIVIGMINALILIGLALGGEQIFKLTVEQFQILKKALFILAGFSVINWLSTVFSQLLISADKIVFTVQLQVVVSIFQGLSVIFVTFLKLSLTIYFFLFSLSISWVVVPLIIKCRQNKLISSFYPKFFWKEFRPILGFSLSVFLLSFFQMTASASRSIILSIFSYDAARVVAEYKMVEVFPGFILSVCGILTVIFLPKASILKSQYEKELFVYKNTAYITIVTLCFCVPIILCADELIILYVGKQYVYLSKWLRLGCVTLIFNFHTVACNSLVLVTGRLKQITIFTVIACVFSVFINIALSSVWDVGSAFIGYFIYVLSIILFNYIYTYRKIVSLDSGELFSKFGLPALPGLMAFIVVILISHIFVRAEIEYNKLSIVFIIILKCAFWFCGYSSLLFYFKIVNPNELRKIIVNYHE